jgi:hypothetical protein
MSRNFDNETNRSESYNSGSRRMRRRIDANQENPERFGELRRNSAMQGSAEAESLPPEITSDASRPSQQKTSMSQKDLVARYTEEQELKIKIKKETDMARKDLEDELDALLMPDQQDLETQPKQTQTHRKIPEENELKIFAGDRLLPEKRGGGVGSKGKGVY